MLSAASTCASAWLPQPGPQPPPARRWPPHAPLRYAAQSTGVTSAPGPAHNIRSSLEVVVRAEPVERAAPRTSDPHGPELDDLRAGSRQTPSRSKRKSTPARATERNMLNAPRRHRAPENVIVCARSRLLSISKVARAWSSYLRGAASRRRRVNFRRRGGVARACRRGGRRPRRRKNRGRPARNSERSSGSRRRRAPRRSR